MPFKNPHPLYNVWMSMKDRCHNPKFKQFKDYGGRGISICEQWLIPKQGFKNLFPIWATGPQDTLLIELIITLDTLLKNCRWASRKQQQRNQTITRKVTIDGTEYIAADLADLADLKTDTIVDRANRGLSYDDVIYKGKHHNLKGLEIGWKYGRGGIPD